MENWENCNSIINKIYLKICQQEKKYLKIKTSKNIQEKTLSEVPVNCLDIYIQLATTFLTTKLTEMQTKCQSMANSDNLLC